MIKKTFFQVSAIILLVALATACSKTQSEYTRAIPADATGVLSVNLKALADKAGADDKENQAMLQKLLESMKTGTDAATFEQVEKIMKSPKESGIDVDSRVYLFKSPSVEAALVAKIGDEKKWQNTLELAAKEQLCQPIAQGDGYSYTVCNNLLLAFNSETLIGMNTFGNNPSEQQQAAIAGMLKQTDETSIHANKAFLKMQEQKGDFNFFASMDAIPAEYTRQFSLGLPQGIDAGEMSLLGNFSFEKGKITASFEPFTENEVLKEQIKKQLKAMTSLNGAFLEYLPASTLGVVSLGANGEEFFKLLQENDDFKKLADLSKVEGLQQLFSSFKGDLTIGVLDISMKSSSPNFVAYAEMKDAQVLKTIYDNQAELGLRPGELTELSENNYLYKGKAFGTPVYFGMKDKQMYATNNEAIYKNIFQKAEKSIKSLDLSSNLKGKNVTFVVSMDAILELPLVKMLAELGGEQAKTYFTLASKVSYLEVTSDKGVAQTTLYLKDKDVNALKQIVDFARQFAGM